MGTFTEGPYTRIVCDPAILGGKPVVKGTRLSVEFLMELLATGSREEVLSKYPQLQPADVEEAIRFAGSAAAHTVVFERRVAG